MYKDYKQSESLDTDFVGGSGIIWMFSGVVLGLLVGLGMYYFSNSPSSTVASVQQSIKKAQMKSANKPTVISQKASTGERSLPEKRKPEPRTNKFSYYAVLPTLDVPVSSAKPIETRGQVISNSVELEKKVALLNGAVEEEIEEIVEVSKKHGDYLLQVASFRKKSQANVTRGRLTKRGIEAYVQTKKIKGRMWYRVVAGPIDHNGADSWKQKAEKLGHRPLIISLR